MGPLAEKEMATGFAFEASVPLAGKEMAIGFAFEASLPLAENEKNYMRLKLQCFLQGRKWPWVFDIEASMLLAGKEMAMLSGNLVAILSGGVITLVTSFVTNRNYAKEQDAEIWENTRDIDSPLCPWTEVYAK